MEYRVNHISKILSKSIGWFWKILDRKPCPNFGYLSVKLKSLFCTEKKLFCNDCEQTVSFKIVSAFEFFIFGSPPTASINLCV